MSKKSVYLAGPIGGLTASEAIGWRREATAMLRQKGIDGYSPMRTKDFLDNGQPLTSVPNAYDHPLTTSKGIMCRDFNDCTTADALLVNYLGVTKPSLGTAMELAWSYDRHIPVVVVAEPDNPNIQHPMMHEAIDFRVDTLFEGIRLIASILKSEDNSL